LLNVTDVGYTSKFRGKQNTWRPNPC